MFVRSLAEPFWKSSQKILMRCLHAFLIITFLAVVISDLAACQPFSHYWQVIPDPGTHCRGGYAYLFTMATFNIITNLGLFLFPLPAVLISRLSKKQLVSYILRYPKTALTDKAGKHPLSSDLLSPFLVQP